MNDPQTSPPPFFIVGSARSGTSLLQVLLDAHPAIAIPPESHLFVRFSGIFSCYGDLRDRSNLRLFVKDLLRDARIREWGLRVSVEDFCASLTSCSIRDVVAHLFMLYARKEGKQRWGDKTPLHARHLDDILAVFPEAKIIHLVRDGRDVAESLNRIFKGKESVWANAHRWTRDVMACHAFKQRVPAEAFLDVKYEDLVRAPAQEVSRIFTFLGVGDADVGTASAVPDTTLRRHYVGSVSVHRSLQEPISTAKIGGFKQRFSHHEIEVFESIAGEALKVYGYPLVSSGTTRVTGRDRLRFFLQDYYLRYQHRLVRPVLLREGFQEINRMVQQRSRTLARSMRPAMRAREET